MDELRHFHGQSLTSIELWRGHIAQAVLNHFLKQSFGLVRDAHAPVVNFDFFAWLHIVVENHFAVSAEHSTANLHR
jgi:hypothetical protein